MPIEQKERSVISQVVKQYLGIDLTNENISRVNRVANTTKSEKQYTLLYDSTSLGVIKYDISKENCNIVFEPNIKCDERTLLRI